MEALSDHIPAERNGTTRGPMSRITMECAEEQERQPRTATSNLLPAK
jgi:hypothetical protein